jgi:hypothetical protein
VFTLKTKTKDLKIAARYTSRPAPAAGSASGGSDGVIVRYTYYGSGSDLSDLYRDTPRPPVQRDFEYSGPPELEDDLLRLAGY